MNLLRSAWCVNWLSDWLRNMSLERFTHHEILPEMRTIMPNYMTAQSQVTFLYYDDLGPAVDFYENILEFELVEDQEWAKIYRTSSSSFIGLVDGTRGFRKPLANSAVLCTLVVDDVPGWYERLKARGVKILREPQVYEEIQVHCFFFEDPGGYAYEVEQFLKPELADVFHKGLRK